ncbi:MAG: tetratricopeptide repeat protein [Gammaproteobacteria bacterium]
MKYNLSLRMVFFFAWVGGVVAGCTQVNVVGTQQSAPIETRPVEGIKPRGKLTGPVESRSAAAPLPTTESEVITVLPLEGSDVGRAVPIMGEGQAPAPTELGRANDSNAATQQLLADARESFVAGDLATAEAVTNRGLRIAPQNPTLWLQLAKIRLGQKSYGEAISLSERAQVLGENNVAVQVDALRIMARARRALGQLELASEAEEKALKLRGNLGAQ